MLLVSVTFPDKTNRMHLIACLADVLINKKTNIIIYLYFYYKTTISSGNLIYFILIYCWLIELFSV